MYIIAEEYSMKGLKDKPKEHQQRGQISIIEVPERRKKADEKKL